MIGLGNSLLALAALLAIGVAGWLTTVRRRNVNLVDSLWSLFFLAAALVYLLLTPEPGLRATIVMILVALWSVRLAVYLTLRNWGQPEDRRYQAIRRNNSPGFLWKSLFIVFGLQAVLAWIISLPLHAAILSPAPIGVLDAIGVALVLFGTIFETLADRQLARFRADPANQGQVMDLGLWRYSRHPNYFGEACVWWGFWLLAAGGGAWWTLISPLLMTLLLLKVSGVTLLEKDIAERRPGYRDYVRRTSAFFPLPPAHRTTGRSGEVA